jgi:hypothetical protein
VVYSCKYGDEPAGSGSTELDKKSKAVPHTCGDAGGRGCIVPTHSRPRH